MNVKHLFSPLVFVVFCYNAYSFDFNWAINVASDGTGGNIVIDNNENVFITGFGTIKKYDSSGALVNTLDVGLNVYFMEVDVSNDIVVIGFFDGVKDFSPGVSTLELTGNNSVFLAKYSNDLNSLIYAVKIKDDHRPTALGIADNGDIYLSYRHTSGVFNSAPLRKYKGSDGSLIWSFSLDVPTAGDIAIQGIDINEFGEVYISGSIYATTQYPDFDPDPGSTFSNIGGKVFFAKYDTSKSFVWARGIATSDDQPNTLINYHNGNVYLASTGAGDVDPNPPVVSMNGRYFIAQYDASNGDLNWGKEFGPSGAPGNNSEVNTLESALGYMFIGGGRGGYLRGYDESGNVIDSLKLASTSYSDIASVSISDEKIYIGGHYSGITDFDPANTFNLTAGGNTEVFLAKYSLPQQTGISSNFSHSKFSTFPNPSLGSFTIQLETLTKDEIQISIWNTLGEAVYNINEEVVGNFTKSIQLNGVPSGIYLVSVMAGEESTCQKLIIR